MPTRSDGSPLKALPLREPGQSLRNDLVDLVLGRLLPGFWIVSVAWIVVLHTWLQQVLDRRPATLTYALVATALTVISVLQFLLLRTRIRNLELGRDGEKVVGQFLDQKLAPLGARILHDIPADGFNLDHVVIAPQGVFVIETKTRTKPRLRDSRVTFAPDGLRVAGYRPERDPIVQVLASSRWLAGILTDSTGQSIQVRGVVVFPGWFIEPMTRDWLNAGHPWVLEPKSLPAFLEHEPPTLSEREVAMFANHLSRYVRTRQEVDRSR